MAMKPTLAQFESMNKFNLIRVNVDKKSSDAYRQNISHKTGRSVPYFAVLNNGRKVGGWVGGWTGPGAANQIAKKARSFLR